MLKYIPTPFSKIFVVVGAGLDQSVLWLGLRLGSRGIAVRLQAEDEIPLSYSVQTGRGV
jgi:hypothetical protein